MTFEQRILLQGRRKTAMELARHRLMVAVFLFIGAFSVMALRTVELGLVEKLAEPAERSAALPALAAGRADIVDRNGVLLATTLDTASLYADPALVMDAEDAARRLVGVLPGLSVAEVVAKLTSSRRFVWLKRKLTPAQQWRVNALGIPGLAFKPEEQRVYPHGRLAAHVLGYVDVDGQGLGGVEHFFNDRLTDPAHVGDRLALSLDARVQHALADELRTTMRAHSAAAAAGVVMDVASGEVLAMVSLPDFDPHQAGAATSGARFNRVTKGVYELGSTFKTFTMASALEIGAVRLGDSFDATEPLRISRFTIRDDHARNRHLTVPEIFAYSSNIGSARIAHQMGADIQQAFLGRLGLLRPATIELTEVGRPITPDRWRDVSTMTISYGHGIAVSPLQLANAIAATVNGGVLIPATLVKESGIGDLQGQGPAAGQRVLSPATSRTMRQLMRLVVTHGTGGNGDAPGYRVGGKTGTAEKAVAGRYHRKALMSSFVGVFPIEAPRYLVLAVVDEPRGTKQTFGFAGGGWVAAPVVRNTILRAAPLLGVTPAVADERMTQRVALHMAAEDD